MIASLVSRLERLEARLPLSPEQRRIVRFLFVGCLNTIVGYCLFAVAYLLTRHPNFALVVATLLGVLFNFFSTGRIVFVNRSWRALPGFIGAYAVALLVNVIVLNALLSFEVPALIAQAICLPIVVVVSYLINARFVFR